MRDALHLAREMGNQRLINLIRVLVPHSQHFLCLLYVKLHSHFNTINAHAVSSIMAVFSFYYKHEMKAKSQLSN